MSIQIFIDLLLDPAAIISRLPKDARLGVTKRGTLFTIGQKEGHGDKYDEVYKFYCELLPSLKMPLPRIELLALTREHKIISTLQSHGDICSKVVRNLTKEGKITLSTNKKSIISVEGLKNG